LSVHIPFLPLPQMKYMVCKEVIFSSSLYSLGVRRLPITQFNISLLGAPRPRRNKDTILPTSFNLLDWRKLYF
jgi:hypothetical protein